MVLLWRKSGTTGDHNYCQAVQLANLRLSSHGGFLPAFEAGYGEVWVALADCSNCAICQRQPAASMPFPGHYALQSWPVTMRPDAAS